MIKLLVMLLAFTSAHLFSFETTLINSRADNYMCRTQTAYQMTVEQEDYDIRGEHNSDDENIADYAGSFSKTLEHDSVTGLLTTDGQTNYEQLLTALLSGSQEDFNAVILASGATRKLVSPQGAFMMSLIGAPSHILPMPSAPTLISDEAATEMIEVYLKALCRDVLFKDYGTGAGTDADAFNGGSITNNAAAILTALGNAYKGPKVGGVVTSDVLFRGISSGDLVGPYISQFWWLSTYKHFQIEEKQYVPIAQAREFGKTVTTFVAIQNGAVPESYVGSDFSGERYIVRTKDAATVVHNDAPGAFFFNAMNILLYNGASLAPNFPYNNGDITSEEAFVTMMVADVVSALFLASQEALKHAWAHKWLANRRLRPEAMAGLVHVAKDTNTNPYNLHTSLLSSHAGIDVLAWIQNRNGGASYLLPLVYPEGSPTHPSYPAGHAVIAGACATILKAFFDDEALMSSFVTPVKPDPTDPTKLVTLPSGEGADAITIGGEINKLASNIAIARNHAGVHYRSDGDKGILLGEQVGFKILQDWSYLYRENGFTGFELTSFAGGRVRIGLTGVVNI